MKVPWAVEDEDVPDDGPERAAERRRIGRLAAVMWLLVVAGAAGAAMGFLAPAPGDAAVTEVRVAGGTAWAVLVGGDEPGARFGVAVDPEGPTVALVAGGREVVLLGGGGG